MKRVLFLCLILSAESVFAQGLWQTVWGTEQHTGLKKTDSPEDLPYKLLSAKDGWYVLGTNTHGDGEAKQGTLGAWVSKFDANGKHLWWMLLAPTSGHDPYVKAAVTADGGLFTADVPESDPAYLRVMRISPAGKVISRTDTKPQNICDGKFCAKDLDRPRLTVRTENGFAAVLPAVVEIETRGKMPNGATVVRRSSESRYFHIRFDEQGNVIKAEMLDIPDMIPVADEMDKGRDMVRISGNAVIIATIAVKKPGVLIRRVVGGRTEWSTTVPTSDARPFGVVETLADGSVFVVIRERNSRATSVVTLDTKGKIVTKDTAALEGISTTLKPTPDGNFLTVSGFEGEGTITKFTPRGRQLFQKSVKIPVTALVDAEAQADGSFVVLAYTKTYGAWYIDGLLFKMDKSGNIGPAPRRP